MTTRRQILQAPVLVASAAAVAAAPAARAGLCLNEDNSHYFFTRADEKQFTAESVASFVDQYAGTQVREILFSANSQRTSFASKVWDPVWKGYDPAAGDDQPLFASTPAAGRATARKWVHAAWRLHQQGLDPYALWIRRAREKGLSPWISMRMNDLHNVDDPQSYMHSTFWREHPEHRRMEWRMATNSDWRNRAFDFNHPEVREYHFRLIEEYCERYDFDGLELDWMRFGFHFKPGQEQQGGEALTGFMRRTRTLLNTWEKKRRHPIALGARVPTRPQTARAMGMDGARWAAEGLVQMLVVTPFWASIETDIPIEEWRRLIGNRVVLAAGLELLVRPYHEYSKLQYNSLETVRGAAATLLSRGADRIYLFNYMDSQTAMEGVEKDYPQLLRECGSLETLRGKPRRHIVTYSDTWAPGEQQGAQLPKTVRPGGWVTFRLHAGTGLTSARLRLEIEGEAPPADAEVHINGSENRLPFDGEATTAEASAKPMPAGKSWYWRIGRCEEWVAIDLRLPRGGKVHWVEISG
jgi:hypothetical protein